MLNNCAVVFSVWLLVSLSSVAEAKKPTAQHNHNNQPQQQQQQQTVVEKAQKQQQQQLQQQKQQMEASEQLLQHTEQLQQESPPPTFCAPKMRKPKSLKAVTEYELCKQECRRKRDVESVNEYVDYLKEELQLAEERAQVEAQQQQNGNGL